MWLRTLSSHCKRAFKKIRIRTKYIKPSLADTMITERNKLLMQGHIQQSRVLDARIAEIISTEGRKKALMFDKYTDNNTSACMSEMWKLKKSLFPRKAQTLPTAKINYQGRLVSEPNELTKLLGEEYGKIRLRKRPSHPLNIEGKKIRKTLLHLKDNLAKKKNYKSIFHGRFRSCVKNTKI